MPREAKPKGGSGLGKASIGLIVATSGFLLIAIILALLLFSRRKIGSSSTAARSSSTAARNIPKTKLRDEDEDSWVALSRCSGHQRRSGNKKVAPATGRQRNFEGADIPGSLAAMDTLALKPQGQANDSDNNSFSVSECEQVPGTPIRNSRRASPPRIYLSRSPFNISPSRKSPSRASPSGGGSPQRSSPSQGSPSRLSPSRGSPSHSSPSRGSHSRSPPQSRISPPRISPSRRARSPSELQEEKKEEVKEDNVDSSSDDSSVESLSDTPYLPTLPRMAHTLSIPPVPLSPIRNRRSGVSPSRVSPKRLPSPPPFVSDGSETYQISTSIMAALSSEIEVQSHGGVAPDDTLGTLERIVHSGSNSSAASASFQDTDTSGDSRFAVYRGRRRMAKL